MRGGGEMAGRGGEVAEVEEQPAEVEGANSGCTPVASEASSRATASGRGARGARDGDGVAQREQRAGGLVLIVGIVRRVRVAASSAAMKSMVRPASNAARPRS